MGLPRRSVLVGVATLACSAQPLAAEPVGVVRRRRGQRRAGQLHRRLRTPPSPGRVGAPRVGSRHGGGAVRRGAARLRDHRRRDGAARSPTGGGVSRTHRSISYRNPPSWGLDRIDQRNLPLDSSYTYPNTASNVHAYIIDTGIRFTHNDFGGRATSGFDAVDGGVRRRLQRPRHARRRHRRRVGVRRGQGRPTGRRAGAELLRQRHQRRGDRRHRLGHRRTRSSRRWRT